MRLALLKHSFLAACLVPGRLAGEGADAVRRDLIAARDATSRHDVPRSVIALGLTVLRSDNGPRLDWPVVHCVAELEDGTEVEGVTLAGTTFVSWSSDPVVEAPEATQQVQATLTVGAPVGGIVRSVNDD